jgi:hypothetical protein
VENESSEERREEQPGIPAAATVLAGAKLVVETAVGLGVLGLLRFQRERPNIEAELERAGLAPAAALTRQAGELLDRGLKSVMSSLGV